MGRLSILLLSVLVILAVLAIADAKKKKKPGPCKVKDCTKCNLTGKKCKKCNSGFKPKQKGKKCVAQPCAVNPCQNGGKCEVNKKKQETCDCKVGYSGNVCEIADPCTPNPCQNSGLCKANGACICPLGFLGDKCQNKDPCQPNPCKNGGSCSGGSCTCADGFSGDNCENEGPKPVFGLAAATRLTKGALIGTIPLFDRTYSVSLDIRADSFVNAWQSVIHFTINSNIAAYGDRTPGIWFWANGGSQSKLHICAPVNGNRNACYNSGYISVGQWINVKVSQQLMGGRYKYWIELDGNEVHTWDNNNAQAFSNVKVYASDPWYNQLNGQIRNVEVITPLDPEPVPPAKTVLNNAGEARLIKGSLIATIPRMERDWRVKVDVKADGFVNAWQSVIHFTINSNIAAYGDRAPAIFYWAGSTQSKLHICSAVSGNRNYQYNSNYIQPGSWVPIEIEQKFTGGVYRYSIKINGAVVHSVTNNNAQAFNNVKVYGSDPWYNQLNGSIRNLEVTTPLGPE